MLDKIAPIKKQHRQYLAKLPFEIKIAMLIRMQQMAREMARASGRTFKGVVWCEAQVALPQRPKEPKKQ
jgi:hypothetical protein